MDIDIRALINKLNGRAESARLMANHGPGYLQGKADAYTELAYHLEELIEQPAGNGRIKDFVSSVDAIKKPSG